MWRWGCREHWRNTYTCADNNNANQNHYCDRSSKFWRFENSSLQHSGKNQGQLKHEIYGIYHVGNSRGNTSLTLPTRAWLNLGDWKAFFESPIEEVFFSIVPSLLQTYLLPVAAATMRWVKNYWFATGNGSVFLRCSEHLSLDWNTSSNKNRM